MPKRQAKRQPTAREILDSLQTEADYQAQIVEYAVARGWLWDHKRDDASAARVPKGMKREVMASGDGSPDLILARAPRVMLIEVKRQSGRLRPKQVLWRDALLACPGVEYLLARPSDWERVREVLA